MPQHVNHVHVGRKLNFLRWLASCLWLLLPAGCGSAAEPAPTDLPRGMTLQAPRLPDDLNPESRKLHEKLSGRVRPGDNAAIWLVHIYGGEAFDAPLKDATLHALGIGTMSPESPLFVSVDQYVEFLDDVSPEQVPAEAAKLEDEIRKGTASLWTSEEMPLLAGYLKANAGTLQTLRRASECTGYYAPLLSIEDPQRLLSASLVIERRLPFLSRLLAVQALQRFADGDTAGCLTNLLACHKLARLLAEGSPFDVSVAKAHVIDSFAFRAEEALLASGKLTAEEIAEFRKAFAELQPIPSPADAANIGERAIIQEEIELLKTDADSVEGFFESPDHKPGHEDSQKALAKVDWKLAHQRADELQDQVVQALATEDRDAQEKLFLELDREYEDWKKTVDEKTDHFAEEAEKDLQGMSRWIGENIAMSLRPAYRQRRNTQDRALVRQDLLSVALALEACQRDQKSFPESLDQLVPEYLEKVPLDPCTGNPFVYTRQGADQAIVKSLGNNRQDDAGKGYNDDFILHLR